MLRWHSFTDGAHLEHAALNMIQDAAQTALTQRGAFHIVLAGGRTPQRVYGALKDLTTDWSAWHIYFGDERCLPPDNTERNSLMAADAWLDHLAIPPAHVHVIPAELGGEAAARAYSQTLAGVDAFDLVLLGLGEDGHTASLFPGQDWGETQTAPAALAVSNAPKPPPHRVSLSAQRLSNARQVVFLITGTAKIPAVTAWQKGDPLPAAAIKPAAGVDVLVDFAV
ncbi:6-phosphogluconolactonase [Magnetovibrio blakemorei]|uniref:6-phosphogluconolactonase n=1 Tax=Magnetovibrio blakemorei TaxID=28181 RepID=A0A1E5Q339_9PROT|nr:6-phosphogluconolactonase [Magnetovibrio blakemorei]OEJ64025.1 6-phosphogluconolactonase [Magnetovibrio blakemorei]